LQEYFPNLNNKGKENKNKNENQNHYHNQNQNKKENDDFSISLFNQTNNIKKLILRSIYQIRNMYYRSNIYLEITYHTIKNCIEIKARKKNYNEIINILNELIKKIIISNIEIKEINSSIKNKNKNKNDKSLSLREGVGENNKEDNKEKEEISELEIFIEKENKENLICQVCLEILNEKNYFQLSLCGDFYCKECLKNMILLQINSQPICELPIKCDICNEIILNVDIFQLFNLQERKFLFYQLVKYFMTKENKDKDLFWCENPDCQYVYRKSQFIEIDVNVRNCPNCLKTFCLLCSHEIIDDIHNDECKAVLLKNLDKNNRNWIMKNTNNCPKCNEIYEKSVGCNHMICKKCKPEVHFCYICGVVIDANK
jgi:hypothetical protein